jgi:hypothetical protein
LPTCARPARISRTTFAGGSIRSQDMHGEGAPADGFISRVALGSISSSRCQTSRAPRPKAGTARIDNLANEPECSAATDQRRQPLGNDRQVTTAWWSQTGSNRRPPACKAGALPTELWPRTSQHRVARRAAVRAQQSPPSHNASKNHNAPKNSLHFGRLAKPMSRSGEGWWAWEDLNFRPHAYQARALTN